MAIRYFNAGTADTLITSGTTLTDLPKSKSRSGTAFYQTAKEKCFDLPATSEVWIKFDVYFDGTNRWRAYNGRPNGITGITAQSNDGGGLSFFANETNVSPNGTNIAGICKTNTLQTFLLHMRAGASSGVIEAWVGGAKIYTYTGDVNHGEDFADIYLQSDGAGTFFSNVAISDEELPADIGYSSATFNTEALIYNAPKGWRYLNPGTSSLIEFSGVDVKGNYSKSVTGVCFNGGSYSQDCFNTPAGLKEVWIRFDLWTQRQGSGGVSYSIGHYSSSTGYIIGVSRSTTAVDTWTFKITSTAGTIHGTPDGISRCLLHIKSHATDGLCELNVNGDTISTSGNINGGRDITPLIIWANDSGYCYFSNIIVSESPLPLDAGWHRDIVPAEAQITAPKLNVRLKGADVQIPLRTKRETGSVTVRVGNSNFYCPATATASLQAAVTFRLDDANHRLINSFG